MIWTKYSKTWTIVMLNKLRCHTHFQFSANQITWSRLLIKFTYWITNSFRSQMIWIYTVCKGRAYPGLAGLGLMTRIPMACLLWLMSADFWVPRKNFRSLKKINIWECFKIFIFLILSWKCMLSVLIRINRWSAFNEYFQDTIIL